MLTQRKNLHANITKLFNEINIAKINEADVEIEMKKNFKMAGRIQK